MKIARLLCVAAAAVLTGAVLLSIRARAQTAVLPNTLAVKDVLAEQFLAEQTLKTANSNLESAKILMDKGITTSKQVEAAQASANHALAQYESIAARLKSLNSSDPIKAATTTAPATAGVEYKTEYREETFEVQVPVTRPDGVVETKTERVTRQVPVTIAYPTTVRSAAVAAVPVYAPAIAAVMDEESQKLFEQEKAAAAEVESLRQQLKAAKSETTRVELRTKLREKLAEIFDLQQKRRAHEVSGIEERVARLKETMNKRDAAKDSIVDRRLELLTGGVDELGWEETGSRPTTANVYGTRAAYPQYNSPNPLGVPQLPSAVPAPPTRGRATTGKTRSAPAPVPTLEPQPAGPQNIPPSADPAAPAPAIHPAPAVPSASPAPPAPPVPSAAPADPDPPAAAAPVAPRPPR